MMPPLQGNDPAVLRRIAEGKPNAGKKARGAAEVEKAEYERFEKTEACERLVRAGIARRKCDDAGARIAKQKDKDRKKAAKTALKQAKKDAAAKAKAIAARREIAEYNANIRGRELNKSDFVNICKTIVNRGPDAQPGVTGHAIFKAMQKMADQQFGHDPRLSAPQRFDRFCKSETGATMLRAAMVAKTATIEDLEDEDQEPDQQNDADSLAAYRRLMQIANNNPSEFARVYQDPRYRSLVEQDKAANRAAVSKSMGLR
jgi:hypothetical protein